MKKILVAEDNKLLATTYQEKLIKAGFEVKVAADGEEALVFLQQFVPDLIVLDIVMPKRDGFSVLEAIRKDPQFSKITVLVATNLEHKEGRDRAKALGANDYFTKSELSLDELIKKINFYLSIPAPTM